MCLIKILIIRFFYRIIKTNLIKRLNYRSCYSSSNNSFFFLNYNSNTLFIRSFVYRSNFLYFINDYLIRFVDVEFVTNRIFYISDINEKNHLRIIN